MSEQKEAAVCGSPQTSRPVGLDGMSGLYQELDKHIFLPGSSSADFPPAYEETTQTAPSSITQPPCISFAQQFPPQFHQHSPQQPQKQVQYVVSNCLVLIIILFQELLVSQAHAYLFRSG